MRKTGWYWVKHLGYLEVNQYCHPDTTPYGWNGWSGGFTDEDYSYIGTEPIEPPENV